jgi:hypothetical protein
MVKQVLMAKQVLIEKQVKTKLGPPIQEAQGQTDKHNQEHQILVIFKATL